MDRQRIGLVHRTQVQGHQRLCQREHHYAQKPHDKDTGIGTHAHHIHEAATVLLPITDAAQQERRPGYADSHRQQQRGQVVLHGKCRHGCGAGRSHNQGIEADDGHGTGRHPCTGRKSHPEDLPRTAAGYIARAQVEQAVLLEEIGEQHHHAQEIADGGGHANAPHAAVEHLDIQNVDNDVRHPHDHAARMHQFAFPVNLEHGNERKEDQKERSSHEHGFQVIRRHVCNDARRRRSHHMGERTREKQSRNGKKNRHNQGIEHGGGEQSVGFLGFSPADINRAGLLEAHGNHVREDGKQHEDGRCKTMGSHGVFPQVMPHDNTVDNAANGIGQFCIDQNQHGLHELFPAEGGYVA